jgi:hypothetical protein
MIAKPMTFEAALADLQKRKLLPVSLGSAALRRLAAAYRRQSLFAATLTKVEVLSELQQLLEGMAKGEINMADARLAMKQSLAFAGYDPETGFPGDQDKDIPPAERHSLQDLSGTRRLNLIIETNYRTAANRAFTEAGQTATRRYQFPAWELVRIYTRRVPRGFKTTRAGMVPVAGEDWFSRWTAAGGSITQDGPDRARMIATKDSPVWQALGDGVGGYDDTLNNPFPPFAFQSGFGVREVHRKDAIRFGIIDGNEMISKAPAKDEELQAAATMLTPAAVQAFRKELAPSKQPGKLTLSQMVEREAYAALDAYRAKEAAR